jgi:tryptophan synthase alpha subunit
MGAQFDAPFLFMLRVQNIVQLCDIVYLKVSHGSTGVQGVFCDTTLYLIEKHIRTIRNIKQDIVVAAGIGIQTPEHIKN